MAISVNWISGVITVPRTDMTLIQTLPTEIRQLDLNSFHLELRDLEDNVEGRPWPKTHTHNTTVTLGGVTYARVIEILAPYTVTFEDGQFAVNLVGANSNVGDRVNVNQVSVRSANSAGLVDLEVLIASAYQGHVVVSSSLGQAGTDEPIGTFKVPSSNMVDALAIAIKQGVREFIFLDSLQLNEDYSLGYEFTGVSPFVKLTLNAIANVSGCAMSLLTVEGELDGLNTVRDCSVLDVTGASGFFESCSFRGSTTLNGKMDAYNCYSQVEGGGYPTFDVGAHNFVVRGMKGSVGVINAALGHLSSIGLSEGRLIVDSSNVGGDIHMRGEPFAVEDTSGPICSVIDETASHKVSAIHGQVTRSIFVNTENVTAGAGYQHSPYNTWSAAIDDAEAGGLHNLRLLADATVDRQIKNFTIVGDGLPTIDLNSQNMDKSTIERCTVTGSYIGSIQVVESAVVDLSGMAGAFLTISASGILTAAPSASLLITDVQPASPATSWTMNMNSGQPSTVGVHNISGEMVVTNMDDAGDVLHLHFDQGEVNISASCTNGTLVVTGDAEIIEGGSGVNLVDNTTRKMTKEIRTRLGLEQGNAWTDTPTQSEDESGDIVIVNGGDGTTTSTGTRQ